MQPTAPIEREMEQREKEKEGVTFERDYRRFSMRPYKDKEKATNGLFFACFPFNNWAWFQGWPDIAGYYLKIFVHRVQTVSETGRTQRGMVICETQMNKYARETLSTAEMTVPEPFPGTKVCPFCVRSDNYWTKYKEAKKAAGIENVSTERFKELMQAHPEIQAKRELARSWGAQETFYFMVFDYSKYAGEVKLQDDEPEELFWQGYFGPAPILEGLYSAHKSKCKFWDFEGGGFRVVNVTRDNAKGARFCKYSVQAEFEPSRVDAETLGYLINPPAEDFFDPSNWIETWSIEDKKAYVTAYGDGSPTPNDSERNATSAPEEGAEAGRDPEKPAATAQSASPAARPRRLGAATKPAETSQAPTTPPPTAAAPAAPAAAAPAVAPAPASQDAPPAPAAGASDAPKRPRVSWRK